ncbi:MAG: non-canonical purine NTP pyrophosphatase, partial [Gammaproteobacteria bacterium]
MKRQVVIATGNRGKLAELIPLLAPLGLEPVAQSEFGLTGVAEDAPTFIENALAKARAAAHATGLPAIADDSGLEVAALDGAPGVHSARYAGEHGNDDANNEKLLAELRERPEASRQACFRCIAVYL